MIYIHFLIFFEIFSNNEFLKPKFKKIVRIKEVESNAVNPLLDNSFLGFSFLEDDTIPQDRNFSSDLTIFFESLISDLIELRFELGQSYDKLLMELNDKVDILESEINKLRDVSRKNNNGIYFISEITNITNYVYKLLCLKKCIIKRYLDFFKCANEQESTLINALINLQYVNYDLYHEISSKARLYFDRFSDFTKGAYEKSCESFEQLKDKIKI